MSVEENKAIVQRYYDEVLNGRDLSLLEETHAVDYVHHDPSNPADIEGREGTRKRLAELMRAFPDFRYTIEDMIAEGDRVMVRWMASLTHKGEFEGLRPTGKRAVVQGIYIHRLSGGKIVEEWALRDTLGLLQQLGVLPSAGNG